MSADPFAPPAAAAPVARRMPRPPRPSVLWPQAPETAAPPGVLVGALIVGVLAAATLRSPLGGLGYTLVGLGVLGVVVAARRGRDVAAGHRGRVTAGQATAFAGTAVLLTVPVLRSAPWLVALALLAACLLTSLALVAPRTWTGLVIGATAGVPGAARTARWVSRSLRRTRLPWLRSARVWLVAGVTAGLVAVFGALFAAADPAYASLVDRVAGFLDFSPATSHLPVLLVVAAATLVAAYLAQQPPHADALAPAGARPVGRWECAVPLAGLDLLFLSFLLVQVRVLFGGRDHVLATAGLTYAAYARQGFWQLTVVTVLTLAVVAAAVRWAPRTGTADRAVLRTLLGALCLLALAVVASAVHRMWVYEQQFGFTRLRLVVSTAELTLGGVFVLLLVAGIRLRGSWLPRAVVGLAVGALLALAAADPDAVIAEHNITRYEQSGRIDLAYLAGLSPDAVPAFGNLPPGLRGCALQRLAPDLAAGSEPWYDVDLARRHARQLLQERPAQPCPTS